MNIGRDEIVHLTEEYGGRWGINHTRRLLSLVSIISAGQPYDEDAVWLAAHLHDWGAYPPWAQVDVDHAVRSQQVAEAFINERGYPEEWVKLVLECIEHHHNGGTDRSFESILLSDADALDFLGVVGILRDFSKNPKDMRKAYETARARREKVPGLIQLSKSKEIAAVRIRQMDDLLAQFEKDSFGFF
jgi:uncharacterized protein